MPVLSHRDILRLHAAAIKLGLANEREALLVGLAPAFVHSLPRASGLSAQILVDLGTLNATETMAEGVPLKIWIQNALALSSPHEEAHVFRRALFLIDTMPWEATRPDAAALLRRHYPASPIYELGQLIRTSLPRQLMAFEPRPVLVRAGLPTDMITGELRLDQWTYVCEWLSNAGVRGVVFTFRLIEQIQSEVFSESLSRWAAEFIELVLAAIGGGDGPNGTIVFVLRSYATSEERRWAELRHEIDALVQRGELSEQALLHVTEMVDMWCAVASAMTLLPEKRSSARKRVVRTGK